MNRTWKLVLLLIGIFAAGAALGSLVTLRVIRQRLANRQPPERSAPAYLKRMTHELGLSPEQSDQIQPIVRRNMEELGRLRSRSFDESRAVFERMQKEIAAKLTPEQVTRFEKMNRDFRERVRRFVPERAGRPHGSPDEDDEHGAAPPPPRDAPPARP